MNFRAIDPTDNRSGLSGAGQVDREIWEEFFDTTLADIRTSKLNAKFEELWGAGPPSGAQPIRYAEFGDAPNDDPRELQIFAAKVRKGQPLFRSNLMAAYGERCAVTGFGPPEVLEAAHIVPHSDCGINELDNGLLLRADIHTLFDAGLLRIAPKTLRVEIDVRLQETPYKELEGVVLRTREDGEQMGTDYLEERFGES